MSISWTENHCRLRCCRRREAGRAWAGKAHERSEQGRSRARDRRRGCKLGTATPTYRWLCQASPQEEYEAQAVIGADRSGNGPLSVGLSVLLAILVYCTPGSRRRAPVSLRSDDRQNADRLMVVDCLLPAQVHQLGTRRHLSRAAARNQDDGLGLRDSWR